MNKTIPTLALLVLITSLFSGCFLQNPFQPKQFEFEDFDSEFETEFEEVFEEETFEMELEPVTTIPEVVEVPDITETQPVKVPRKERKPLEEAEQDCLFDNDCPENDICFNEKCIPFSILESKEDCENQICEPNEEGDIWCVGGDCSQPCENCREGQFKCMLTDKIEKNKCVECFIDFGCNEGYVCNKYECVKE